MDDYLRYLMAASFLKGLGPRRLREVIAFVGDVDVLFTEKLSTLAKLPIIGSNFEEPHIREEALARADREIEFMVKHRIQPLAFTDANYPYRLKQCDDAPIILYVKGNNDLNTGHFIAIVGTRRITSYGKELCETLVADFAHYNSNVTIVSGLAYGVDVTAHRSALAANINTIGVVGHGLDKIYPASHQAIAKQIVENNGSIVTEYVSQTQIDPSFFVQRNRIIAGLCDAIVIIESAVKGGALLTARAASDYNRDLFAIPGRTTDLFSEGCNRLIEQEKAHLICSAEDVMRAMQWSMKNEAPKEQLLFSELTDTEQQVVQLLHASKLHTDILSIKLNLSISKTLALMLQMEFKGLIRALPGGMFELTH